MVNFDFFKLSTEMWPISLDAYSCPCEVVSVGVGHREDVDGQVVRVLWVSVIVLNNLVDEVRVDGGTDPLVGVNACEKRISIVNAV